MWFVLGGLAAVLYLVLIITLGVATLRNGHLALFIFGLFFPLLWVIGALSQPRPQPI
jgi:hypothetical protein